MTPDPHSPLTPIWAAIGDLRARTAALESGAAERLPGPIGRYEFYIDDRSDGGAYRAFAVDEGDTADSRKGPPRASKWEAIVDAWEMAVAMQAERIKSFDRDLSEARERISDAENIPF